MEEKCGLEASEQSVLFRGKVLSLADKFEDIGVAPGDTLNVVKGKRQRTSKSFADSDVTDMPEDESESELSAESIASGLGGGGGGGMSSAGGMGGGMLGGMSGMDEESMKKALEKMSPEDIQKAMKQMDQLLDNK